MFFSFCKKLIKEILKKIRFYKIRLNKDSFRIIKNIGIIYFINEDEINEYKNFLLNKLKTF